MTETEFYKTETNSSICEIVFWL